ncbi:MAG TPA: PAS domain S-box protein [Nocardioidaceae bacterium]|nr:PAS domain S-box protein [Nocardioidaceae bacterium]
MTPQQREHGTVVGPHVIFGLDASGVCTLSTGPGLENLGLKPGQVVGQNMLDLYAHDRAAVEHLRRVLSGESFTVEREFNGRILSLYYEPSFAEDGSVSGALGVTTDVTEQRKIEDEARAARERARLLADVSKALSSEVVNPDALLRVVVRSVTEAVADAGAVWLPVPGRDLLEPRTVWHVEEEARKAWYDWRAELPKPSHLLRADVEHLEAPLVLDLSGPDSLRDGHGRFLAQIAERFDLATGLRVPLRSQGALVGVIEVARGAMSGTFTEGDIALVTDVAERCALALRNSLLLDAQREARQQLVKFQALADASPNFVAISDPDGKPVYLNPRVLEMDVEVSPEDIWLTLAEVTGKDAAHRVRSALAVTGRWVGDIGVDLPEGQILLSVDVMVLRHPDTRAELGTAWIGQDVTELRAAEAALREANADLKRFKALVEASPDFIAIAALDGTVKYVNPPGKALVGMDPDVDVSRTTIPDYLTPEGLQASVDVEQPAVIANGHWEGESTLRNHRGGPPIPVAIASFLIRDAETGEPFALATVQRDISERIAAETALRELAEQRQALLTRLVDAQDAERTRIAADVHDDPVQALAAVDLRLGLLRRQLHEHAPQLLETLEPLEASVTGATDRLRALLFDLEPPDLKEGLTGALRSAAAEVFEGTTTHWTVNGVEEPDMPDSTRTVAYRIAKEALINTRKHAQAANVEVRIAASEGGLEVTVADDGVGLGPQPSESTPGHRGLFTMQDRAAIAGGHCEIANRRPTGTLASLWLPGPAGAR